MGDVCLPHSSAGEKAPFQRERAWHACTTATYPGPFNKASSPCTRVKADHRRPADWKGALGQSLCGLWCGQRVPNSWVQKVFWNFTDGWTASYQLGEGSEGVLGKAWWRAPFTAIPLGSHRCHQTQWNTVSFENFKRLSFLLFISKMGSTAITESVYGFLALPGVCLDNTYHIHNICPSLLDWVLFGCRWCVFQRHGFEATCLPSTFTVVMRVSA